MNISTLIYKVKRWFFANYYFLVKEHYRKLDTIAYTKYGLFSAAFSKQTLAVMKSAAARECNRSGRCAIKEWKPSNEMKEKGRQLAWKASQEADPEVIEEAMRSVSKVVELSPEEIEKRKKAFDEINGRTVKV